MPRHFSTPRPTPTLVRLPHALARAVSSASGSASTAVETGDRQAVQSIVKTMHAAELLTFNNTSGITITAIIAVVAVLASLFVLCILVAAILSKTNAPRTEAFPYTQPGPAQLGMFQPSAASRPKSDLSARSPLDVDHKGLLDSASPLAGQEPAPEFAGNASLHGRSGSSGVDFPGPSSAARRGQRDQPSPLADGAIPPMPPQPGMVNYNGRDMTITIPASEGDEAPAESRWERERARRSTVMDGPPPATNGKRMSKYRMSTVGGPSVRMSMSGKKGQRQSRVSRISRAFDPADNAGEAGMGNLSSRRRSVTSTGPGVYRQTSMRWDQEEGDLVGRRSTGGRRGTARQSRVPRARQSQVLVTPPQAQARHSIISADSLSMYESPSVYTSRDSLAPDWAALKPQQTSALDPLQVPGPSPFVLASH